MNTVSLPISSFNMILLFSWLVLFTIADIGWALTDVKISEVAESISGNHNRANSDKKSPLAFSGTYKLSFLNGNSIFYFYAQFSLKFYQDIASEKHLIDMIILFAPFKTLLVSV